MIRHPTRPMPFITLNSLLMSLMITYLGFSVAYVTYPMRTFISSTTRLKDTAESEWYTPPPQLTIEPTRKRPGLAPAENIIESPDDFRSFLFDQDDGRLAIVEYHASWCKSCARFNMHMGKLLSQQADMVNRATGEVESKGQIRFASIEWGANEDLCRSEGIETLPTTRFYVGGKMVQEVTGGTKNFYRVQELVEYYTRKLTLEFATRKLERTLDQGKEMLEQLLEQGASNTIPASSALFDSPKSE